MGTYYNKTVLNTAKLQDGWADFIDELHKKYGIHWWCTITFKDDIYPEAAINSIQKNFFPKLRAAWLSKQEKRAGTNFLVVVAMELSQRWKNTPHFHFFVGNGECHANIEEWEFIAEDLFGKSKFEEYNAEEGARYYSTKEIDYGAEVWVQYAPTEKDG